MSLRDTEIRIGRIDLSAMPAGGERRLREAVERELALRLGESAAAPAPPPGRAADADWFERGIAGELASSLPPEPGR